jgi:hypothetical protein
MRPPVKAGGMGFFDQEPIPEPEAARPHHPWELPEPEFPGVVPTGPLLLGRTEQLAVAITSMAAYTAGFEIFVTARIRPGDRGDRGRGAPRELAAARRAFRFGLQLPDGTKVIGREDRPDPDSEPAGPILVPYAFGGGPRLQFSRWWAWPLPPPWATGVRLRVAAGRDHETRAGIDAQLILNAARASIQQWAERDG